MEQENKFNWKRLLITILFVIIATVAVGGGVWYVMDQQAKDDKDAHDKQIQELQNQIDELNTGDESSDEEETTETTTNTTEKSEIIEIPELAIKFAVPTSISDLAYSFDQDYFQVGFTTNSLIALGCDTRNGTGPLGNIRISKIGPDDIEYPRLKLIKQVPVDGRYLYYIPGISGCSDNESTVTLQNEQATTLREALNGAVEIRQQL